MFVFIVLCGSGQLLTILKKITTLTKINYSTKKSLSQIILAFKRLLYIHSVGIRKIRFFNINIKLRLFLIVCAFFVSIYIKKRRAVFLFEIFVCSFHKNRSFFLFENLYIHTGRSFNKEKLHIFNR